MAWSAVALVAVQCLLLLAFVYFAFFNYLYGLASLFPVRLSRTKPSNRRIGVVVVAFNERFVLEDTIAECDRLTHPNRVLIVADDSTDALHVEELRRLAIARGCHLLQDHGYFQHPPETRDGAAADRIEIWESPGFVLFHRPSNIGFKGGSLRRLQPYLRDRGIELMYLLDADWHPQPDALEQTLEVLEAHDDVAFVQTRRVSDRVRLNAFQRAMTLSEEGCYYVDLPGRQVVGHPILFSGCCALMRLDAIEQVGGFSEGHLTEDLDLTNRLWIAGWKGIYHGGVVNHGEFPSTYEDFRRQQERWVAGTARALREHLGALVRTPRLNWMHKLAAVRQNAYYVGALLTSVSMLLAVVTLAWVVARQGSYEVESYLVALDVVRVPVAVLAALCLFSNFVEPVVMIAVKLRRPREFAHFPMMVWYAWGCLHTYAIGNIKGLFRVRLDWFRTPKFGVHAPREKSSTPVGIRLLNALTLVALVALYSAESWALGWLDPFAVLFLPAFAIASWW